MQRAKSFFRSPLFPIFMIVFIDVLGFAITIPVLPFFIQNELGGSVVQITSLTAIFFGAQFFATPQLGRLSDRVGRRPVLIVSQFGSLIGLLMSGLAPNVAFLYVARVIDGLTGGNIAVAQAYLCDVTTEEDRASGFGIIIAARSASMLIGPAFGGLVAARFGPRMPFFLAALISLFTIFLSYKLLPESIKPQIGSKDSGLRHIPPVGDHTSLKKGTQRLKAFILLPAMLLLMGISLGDRIAFFIYQPTWVLWIKDVLLLGHDLAFTQQAVGVILTVIGAVGIATQIWLIRPLTKKFGEKQMVIWGTLMRGFSWTILVLFPFLVPTMLVVPLIAIGGGIALPSLTALITYRVPPDQQGYAIGVLQATKSVGRIAGSILGGVIFQFFSPSATMGVAAMMSAILLMAIFRLPSRNNSQVANEF